MPPGVAFSTIGAKTSAGRNTRPKPRMPEVEEVACPAHDGTHALVTGHTGATACEHCGGSWAALDAELRRSR